MNRAILAVSYGVRHVEEIEASIAPVERAIGKAFDGYAVMRAFICPEGVEAIRCAGQEAYHYTEVLESLRKSGCDEIYVSPLLLAPGVVYDGITGAVSPLPTAKPLLDGAEDLLRIARIYAGIAERTGREVVLMGHGSTSQGDDRYVQLSKVLPEHVHLACRSGGLRLEDILPKLQTCSSRSLLLMPLMLTAGRHARGEMAGERPDSWKNILRDAGFDVDVHLEGMGSIPEVQDMFVEKVRAIMC